jgi:hypothetical protein
VVIFTASCTVDLRNPKREHVKEYFYQYQERGIIRESEDGSILNVPLPQEEEPLENKFKPAYMDNGVFIELIRFKYSF